MFFQQVNVDLTEFLEELGAAFDVREEETDRTGRKICHAERR
jgi:hypothetical protein